jgi:V/A-type H+-transporting ATPase subunit K
MVMDGLVAIGAGLAIGISGLATALAQKDIGAAAVGATAENEKMFGKGLIYMVIPETIVIFGMVIAFMLMMQ